MASVATVVVLNGLKLEVRAAETATKVLPWVHVEATAVTCLSAEEFEGENNGPPGNDKSDAGEKSALLSPPSTASNLTLTNGTKIPKPNPYPGTGCPKLQGHFKRGNDQWIRQSNGKYKYQITLTEVDMYIIFVDGHGP